ncbi:chorismate synthase [Salix suchowensis]|nr:chorismate synthase [Salix suchowensis]
MSTFGKLFRVTTYGESHCASVGAIIDGCPRRRRPGQSNLTTPVSFIWSSTSDSALTGTLWCPRRGVTLGTPIGLLVKNEDQRPHDYSETDLYPRPSHADYTYLEKYGIKASSGGGRSSARETIGRVAAGAIAEKYLKLAFGIEVVAFVSSVGKIHFPSHASPPSLASDKGEDDDDVTDALSEEFCNLLSTITREQVDAHPTRCPHHETAERMTQVRSVSYAVIYGLFTPSSQHIVIGRKVLISTVSLPAHHTCQRQARLHRRNGNLRHTQRPSGLGEPVFDKFEAALAHAMLSIPATKSFEIGSGFRGTETNWSGGVQGGITNGEDIYFRLVIFPLYKTVQYDGTPGVLAARGRHDPCAMAAIVVLDQLLIQNARKTAASLLPPITTLPPTMVMPAKESLASK